MPTHRPHDGLVKITFSDPEAAAGELRSVLPAALSEAIDWTTLRVEEGTLLAPDLTERFADLLYSVRLAGHGAWIYVLFEHQSTADRMMVARALISVARIWDRLLAADRDLTMLPPVIPVLLTHAEGGWHCPRELTDVLDVGDGPFRAAMLELVPRMSLAVVDDLTLVDDDALEARPLPTFAKMALAVLRDVRDAPDLTAALRQLHARWMSRLDDGDPRDERALRAVLGYIPRPAGPIANWL
jgi:predicted transposase YdaD